jgi:hypothetical protein
MPIKWSRVWSHSRPKSSWEQFAAYALRSKILKMDGEKEDVPIVDIPLETNKSSDPPWPLSWILTVIYEDPHIYVADIGCCSCIVDACHSIFSQRGHNHTGCHRPDRRVANVCALWKDGQDGNLWVSSASNTTNPPSAMIVRAVSCEHTGCIAPHHWAHLYIRHHHSSLFQGIVQTLKAVHTGTESMMLPSMENDVWSSLVAYLPHGNTCHVRYPVPGIIASLIVIHSHTHDESVRPTGTNAADPLPIH